MLEPAYAFDAFISYRRQEPDKSFARNLLQSLQTQGYRVAFDEITFSPEASFLEEMERCVRTSRFVLAVVSSRYFDSGNTQEEAILTKVMDMRDRKRRLIPLILEEIELPYWLYNLVGIHFTDPDPLVQPLDRLFNTLGVPTQVEQTNLMALDKVCPYQGLEAFTPETRQFFYGRQATVELLLQKLTEFNFVPVIGVSGSGKSSVVRAGLMPSLGPNWLVLEPIKPDAEPMAELRQAMRSLFTRAADKNRVTELLNGPGLLPVLEMLPATLKAGVQKVLLVIDQFEEVFTVCPIEDDRARFINCITAVQTLENSPLAIVTTMRADFVEQWLDYGDLVQTIQHQAVWLGRLQGEDLVQAIEQPAKDLGYAFGPGLRDLILDDVQVEKNCLPLLEFALTELWEKRDHPQKELPLKAYTDMQRLTGALNKRAEDVYNDNLASDEERQWAKRICLELVRIGPEVKDTRQRQPRGALLDMGKGPRERDVINEVIEALIRGRLLVPTREDEVDLAHEALMVGWQRFAEWRQEDRDRRRLVQRVRDAETEWNSKGQDERYLLQGGLLEEVREQWKALQDCFISSTQRFYQCSDKQEKDQGAFVIGALTEAELQAQSLKIMDLISINPLEAAAIGIHNTGISQRKLEGKIIPSVQKGLRTVFEKAKEINCFQSHKSPTISLSFSPSNQYIASGNGSNIRIYDYKNNLINSSFLAHKDSVNSVAYSPDGQLIASGSQDKTIRLWSLDGTLLFDSFVGTPVISVAFSPNGQLIASGSDDCKVRLWDLSGQQISNPFTGHSSFVSSVAFSPDNETIVSGSADNTIRLWRLNGQIYHKPIFGHSDQVMCLSVSPDGERIVSGGGDKKIRLWNFSGAPIGHPLTGHTDFVSSVMFSPDGQKILSSSGDKTVRLWQINESQVEAGKILIRHEDAVFSSKFSPDGQLVASCGIEGEVKISTLESIQAGNPFFGHKSGIESIAFSPDGKIIVSGSSDKTIRSWTLDGMQIDKPLSSHLWGFNSVSFSPNGKFLVGVGGGLSFKIWNIDIQEMFSENVSRMNMKCIFSHESEVNSLAGAILKSFSSVAFSPDGQIFVVGGRCNMEGILRVFDLSGNPVSPPFGGHSSEAKSVAFSPDGKSIISGGYDKNIYIWDLLGNSIRPPLQGHFAPVNSVDVSTRSQAIVSGSDDKTIRLWNFEGDLIGEPFQGHSESVNAVAFSPDGQTIVSGSNDHTVRLWDLGGNPISDPLEGHTAPVTCVRFSPDGKFIISGSDDCTIRLWRDGTWHDWLTLCCNRFRYHPLFKNADREPFISACKVCEEYVWSLESSEVTDG